jgi:hypothetical protein
MLVALLPALLMSQPAPAAEAPYHQRIEKFFALLMEGKSREAVEFIYSDNPWMAKHSDAVQNVINQVSAMGQLVGRLRNHELLQEKVVADRFAYLSYMAAYDRQPFRFVFEYYRPEDEWRVFSFSLDDKLDNDIEDAARKTLLPH